MLQHAMRIVATVATVATVAIAGMFGAFVSVALAQGYPVKPIRVVIGYAPGGAADAGIRPLARALETPICDAP